MKTELLAPAGSYESLKAAINAGADAVYMGGQKFGARAYAANGDEKTICEAIHYAHLFGKKLYLTVNTLLKEQELEQELYEYLRPFYEEGLDAVIVQDPGVLTFIKKHFPELHIHASTQMTVTGPLGAKILEDMGCSRVVTARELSLKELCEIRKSVSMEIESFVHGALCYCYSGQCLMSSIFGGRSGNRGRCAQPCRLPYEVFCQGKRQNDRESQYVLSPKDMCTVELLPEIIKAGVTSLKIEGRMKKPEYTAGVVRIYRKYLDLYECSPREYRVSREDLQELYDLYNRDGFHRGYYKDRGGPEMMAIKNEKTDAAQKVRKEVLFKKLRSAYMETENPLLLKGKAELICGTPAKLSAGGITVSHGMVERALRQPLTRERIETQLCKTGGTPYAFETLDIHMDESVFVPMQTLNELRRRLLEQLTLEKLTPCRRRPADVKRPEYRNHTTAAKTGNRVENGWNSLSVAVETKEQLYTACRSPLTDKIYASLGIFMGVKGMEELKTFIDEARSLGKRPCLALPHVVREGSLDRFSGVWGKLIRQGLSGFLVRNLESLGLLLEQNLQSYVTIDANLYTYNKEAQNFYKEMGVSSDTAPLELNSRELAGRDNGNSEMLVYGYLPLMVSAQCLNKNLRNCSRNSEVLILQDRYKKKFCVKCVCDFCYNIIYNSLPLGIWKEADLVKKLGFEGLRLHFTLENQEETEEILKGFGEIYLEGKEGSYPSDAFTKGHFRRGVE